jgi:hypothetical protein
MDQAPNLLGVRQQVWGLYVGHADGHVPRFELEPSDSRIKPCIISPQGYKGYGLVAGLS